MSSKWTWGWFLGCAGLAGVASALSAANSALADANPYSVISDRNVFHLNPPPPPPPSSEDIKPPELPKVMLTGFIKKHDSMEVLLAIPPKDNKESTVYLSLTAGEKEHGVELVKVRYDKEEVDIINSGTPETLTVKSNSFESSAPAPAAPAGGREPGMRRGIPGFGRPPGLPMRNLPFMPRPSAEARPSGGSAVIAGGGGGGSAIVSGGAGGGNAISPFGSAGLASGGAIVSGGGAPYMPNGTGVGGNNVGQQIAASLFNQQTGQYQMPTPTAPPADPLVQGARMLMQNAQQGGPPLPPPLQQLLEPPTPPERSGVQ